MTRVICFILGLAFIIIGVLGMTNFVPMLSNDLIYLNIIEIVLGVLGVLFGMYSRQSKVSIQQGKENVQLRESNDNFVKAKNDQLMNDNLDKLTRENEQLKQDIAKLQDEKDQMARNM